MSKHWFITHLIKKFTLNKKLGLDVGIGENNWKEFKKCKMIGIDRKNTNSDIVVDLEAKLPFQNNVFDIIIAINSLNYIVNARQLLSEINRVLKIGGQLICVVDNPNSNNEKNHVWEQMYLDRILQVSGFQSILYKNFRDFLYSKWYNKTSVYAFSVVKKIKEIDTVYKSDKRDINKSVKIEFSKSYNLKTTHPET